MLHGNSARCWKSEKFAGAVNKGGACKVFVGLAFRALLRVLFCVLHSVLRIPGVGLAFGKPSLG